jgi:Zn finger protein HypA/HybF involved in hydrogenase expression
MSLWTWLFRRSDPDAEKERKQAKRKRSAREPIPLPTEPYVFECRACGKVFEARRRRGVVCPECDAGDVELLG